MTQPLLKSSQFLRSRSVFHTARCPQTRWWKAQEVQRIWPETFLKSQERYCVSACSRFQTMDFIEDHVWVLSSNDQDTSAILLHSKKTLFPVFNGTEIEAPVFLKRALKNIAVFAIQGLTEDTETLEKILRPLGFKARQYMDYYLMALDNATTVEFCKKAPPHLKLRIPTAADIEALLPLQAAYEQEEILPQGAILDTNVCRLNLTKIIKNEQCIIAEIGGKIVGKINTNAESFSRYQIGGVYIHPLHRGRGIATYMTAAFVRLLLSKNKAISLYVNKTNSTAIKVYKSCGFKAIADYRIAFM